MGRYLNLYSSSVNKTLKSYCKIRYLMSILKKCPQLTKMYSRELLKCSLQSSQLLRFTRKPVSQNGNVHHRKTCSTFHCHGRDFTKEVKHYPAVRFYSSSSRDEFKAEAPVGVLEETRYSQLTRLGGRLGQSFNQLSTHINMYFKRKNIVPTAKQGIPETLQQAKGAQRQIEVHRVTRELDRAQNKTLTQTCNENNTTETKPPVQESSGLHLFHISSLATRFGESYSYVANHVNSVFSRGVPKVQDDIETYSIIGSKRRRRRTRNSGSEAVNPQPKASVNQTTSKHAHGSSSWEEGYSLFSAHVNKYFGAKVVDEQKSGQQSLPNAENTKTEKRHLTTRPPAQTQAEFKDGLDGLFHSSHNTTNFGESYFQMASHINRYFKGESVVEKYTERDAPKREPSFGNSEKRKTVSVMDCLLHPSSAIPEFLNAYLKMGPSTLTHEANPRMTSPRAMYNKNPYLSQKQAERTTYDLIGTLEQTSSPEALTSCVEALTEHLIRYPSCKILLWQRKTAVLLVRKRRNYRHHQALQSAIREILALVGYVDPVKGRGIRVLSIDGGGTRGVVPLQVLKLLEAETGKNIHQLFDYICGVSTGAVLAFMLGLAGFSLEECEDMYQRFGSEVFRQNRLVGTVKMGWSHSYYNTETWETILREKLGERVLIKTARDDFCPKVSAVSAVVNWGTSPKAFVFRNYNHTPGSLSRYAGGSGYQMWQAVRASSAAPGYFQEFTLQGDIHQDGGIILNNPCALAVHESRLLWPNQPFQCVLSLGTGRYDNVKRSPATATSLRAKISNMISSATDTEGVHTLLDDLLAPNVYFRFNPMLSAEVSLDESRPGALEMLHQDTEAYLERNQPKLARLCLVLGAERSAYSKTMDWVSERAWIMKQQWVHQGSVSQPCDRGVGQRV